MKHEFRVILENQVLIKKLVDIVAQVDTILVDKSVDLRFTLDLLADHKIGALPVVDDDDKIEGILTRHDLQ